MKAPFDLARAKELDAAATPGPWFVVGAPWGDGTLVNAGSEDPHGGRLVCDCSILEDFDEGDEPRSSEDAAFIAAARTLVPELIAQLEQQLARVTKLQHELVASLPTEDERQILRWVREHLAPTDATPPTHDIRRTAAVTLINRLLSQKVNHNG